MPELPELDTETLGAARKLADIADALLSVANGLGFALIGARPGEPDGSGPTLLVPPQEGVARGRSGRPAGGLPPVQSASEMLAGLGSPAPTARAPVRLRRRPVVVVAAPPRHPLVGGPERWVLTADPDGALTAAVAAGLERRGLQVTVIGGDASDVPQGVTGIVHLGAVGAAGEDLDRRIRAGFRLARAAGPSCARFVTVSACGGRFGRHGGASPSGALAGLAKTAAREWPECRVLALDLGDACDAEAIVEELLGDRGVVEVGLTSEGAWTLTDGPEPAAPGEVPLAPGDLVVASGGGRGVTAAAVLALARKVPVAALLLGRTAPADEPAWAAGVADSDLVRARLGVGAATPREAEAEAAAVRAGREIRATLAALRAAGADATYVAVDGRDAEAVRDAVAAAESRCGPTRALIHGAGVLADKRIADKDDESFERVWSTKVDGLEALIGAVDPAGLRLCCAFTSVAGRYGNAGQCDYAMANEALVQRLLRLRASAPSVRVKALDWGPWDGGMVTPGLKARFEAQGQAVIPIDAGARAFVEELGDDAVEVVLEAPLSRSGAAARTLAADAQWLQDHRIGGRPVVPVAMVVEWLASLGAEIAPGAGVVVRDLEVLQGIAVTDGEDPELTMVWAPTPGQPDRIGVEILGGVARADDSPLGPPRLYRGAIELGPIPPAEAAPGDEGLAAEPFPATRDEIYNGQLFHGPSYQALDELVGISDAGAVAWIRTSTPSAIGVPAARWHTDPVAVDAAFQLGVLWVQHRLGSGVLPSLLRMVRWSGGPPAERLLCRLRVEPGATARAGGFSIRLVGPDDRLVATIEGRYSGDPSKLAVIRAAS
jgi:NADP-dependent 3-hydroxy acid dehydrogenase YdfG